ncbi:MAG TPA: phosphate ABC transporter permease PstA [Phototrophicaceae bacterium]|nr:phosphate ABC transporter permease PstA [Phototrophicaceae bacterium]
MEQTTRVEGAVGVRELEQRRRAIYSVEEARYVRRKAMGAFMVGLLSSLTIIACLILFLIVGYIAVNGVGGLNEAFFTQTPKPLGQTGGGIAQAILGSLEMLLVGAIIAIPVGVGTGIYMAEYGNGHINGVIRFSLEVLASLPSIVIGVFVWALVVRTLGSFSGLAGAIALAFIMIPIIGRSVEEILRLVPNALREAGLALGVPRWRVIMQVVIPTVLPGIFTGVVLGVARAAGETAPLLLTALGNDFINFNLGQPMAAMPLAIYNYASSPYPDWHQKAWTATLVLVLVVALFSLLVRVTTRKLRYVR